MDAAESTSRTNGTNQEEEERKQKSSTVVRAATIIAAVGVTAWALSDNTYTEEEEQRKQKSSIVVGEAATIAAVGVVAWVISRMVFFLVKISRMLFKSAMKMMIADPSCVPGGKSQTSDVWSPPPEGCLKMNTDATCRPDKVYNKMYGDSVERGPSGYGGILRDHYGEWVQGFIGYVGVTDSLTAEFHGILKGLEFLDKPRYKGAILETDNEPAYLWLIEPYKECSKKVKHIWYIIEKCRQLVENNEIEINHVRKPANKCADKLADVAMVNKVEYMEIQDQPKVIDHLVSEDANSNC